MKKTAVLYHGNCPDGFGAALAAWIKLGDGADYIPVYYGQEPPEIEPGASVRIVDFSYSRDRLLKMREQHPDLIVLDHHATAEQDLKGLNFCQFDMSRSGAVLAWNYFHGDFPVPEFFQYLQDRDLWTFELPQSREVSCALRSYPFDFKLWNVLRGNVADLRKEGVALLRLTSQMVDAMCKNHRRVILDGQHQSVHFVPRAGEGEVNGFGKTIESQWACPVANATVFFSEVGERLLEIYPDAPFSAYYMDRADWKRQWGLRSRPDFDCSVIAKAFGGGGHKQASGFVTSEP